MTEKLYKRILWLGVAMAVIFSPLWKGGARIQPLSVILLISFTLIFMWLWRANNSREYKFKSTAIDLPIFLFAALAVVSSIFSIYKHDSVYGLIKLFCYIGIYYLIVNEFDRDMMKRILYLVVGIGAFLSIYGFLQNLNLLGHSWWDPKEFIAATFVNHNHFSGYLELTIPVAAVLITRKHSLLSRLLLISALVIMAVTFILAQSRGAWMSLCVSSLVMMYSFARRNTGNAKSSMSRVVLILLLVAAVISLVYFSKDVIGERMSGSISSEPTGDSFAIRLKIWQGCLDMITHNPVIGTGIGTLVWGYSRYRPEGLNVKVDFAHNDYLQMAAEMGILAPLIAVWLIAIIVTTAVKKSTLDPLKFCCGIGVLSVALHGLVDFNFNIPANMLLFTVWAAFIMSEERQHVKRKR